MFNSRESQNPPVSQGAITAISAGSTIKGDLSCTGDVRIDGTLIGNLSCESKIIIGPKGAIEGNISGNTAEIMGHVRGNIIMSGQLILLGKSVIEGDLHINKLQIAAEVVFNGKCCMGKMAQHAAVSTYTQPDESA
jgi:cytoskeletal protein CcmA (bactofilin family)